MTTLDWFLVAAAVALVFALWVFYVGRDYRNSEGLDIAAITALVYVVVMALVVALMNVCVYFDKKTCDSIGDEMGRDSRHDFYAGCLVQTDDGQYVPKGMLRFNETGEETS